MPTLSDAVLLAAAAQPGDWTPADLARTLRPSEEEVTRAVQELRARGLLQKRRGNPDWGGRDRLRASKAGRAALRQVLRAELLGDAAAT